VRTWSIAMPLYIYWCPDCEIEVERVRPAEAADMPVERPICEQECDRASMALPSEEGVLAGRIAAARIAYDGVCPCCIPRGRR
jgi:hypothetical protein